jgi:hypothetical protein
MKEAAPRPVLQSAPRLTDDRDSAVDAYATSSRHDAATRDAAQCLGPTRGNT